MRSRAPIACAVAALALVAAGCGDEVETAEFTVDAPPAETTASEPVASEKPNVRVPAGKPPKQLQVEDLEVGTGKTAKKGDTVSVDYVGVAYSTEKEFDNSYDRGQPFEFTLGEGQVIAGWDEGVEGMKVGGRRQLVIPPGKAYGAQGQPPDIKPNETLVFVVELRDVK